MTVAVKLHVYDEAVKFLADNPPNSGCFLQPAGQPECPKCHTPLVITIEKIENPPPRNSLEDLAQRVAELERGR